MNQLVNYAARRLIFVVIAWAVAAYVAPHFFY